MKAAIYARYSSDNQREQSIEDQVRVCRVYAQKQGIEVLNDHIYADEARSGSIRDRKGLDALMKSCEEKRFDIVLVDDSSRISRDVYYFNQLPKGFGRQKSYVENNPNYLLSGNIVCGSCGGLLF